MSNFTQLRVWLGTFRGNSTPQNFGNFFLKQTEKLNISGSIDRVFHKCDFKMIEIPFSNEKGEIWIQECKCGKKRSVLFDEKAQCRDIKPL